jgi:hypothetical protein
MFKFLGQASSLAEDDTFVGMKLNFVGIINRLTHRPETETMLDNESDQPAVVSNKRGSFPNHTFDTL